MYIREILEALYIVNKMAKEQHNKKNQDYYYSLKEKAIKKLWLENHLRPVCVHNNNQLWFVPNVDWLGSLFNFHQILDEPQIWIKAYGTREKKKRKKNAPASQIDWLRCELVSSKKKAKQLLDEYIGDFDFEKENNHSISKLRTELEGFLINKEQVILKSITNHSLFAEKPYQTINEVFIQRVGEWLKRNIHRANTKNVLKLNCWRIGKKGIDLNNSREVQIFVETILGVNPTDLFINLYKKLNIGGSK